MKTKTLVVVSLWAVASCAAVASDWPQLGGAERSWSTAEALPDGGLRLETVWRKPLGSGYSGITIAGGAVVTMYSGNGADNLVALDAKSGETRWTLRLDDAYEGHDGSDDGPLATPLILGRRVFTVTPRGSLLAADLGSGKELWRVSLVEGHKAVVPDYGFTTSPVAAGDVVAVQVGGPDGHGLCGFDPEKGEVRFCVGDEPAGYRTPAVVSVGGRPHLVVVTNRTLRGVDPTTGRVLWENTATEDRYGEAASVVPLTGGTFLVADSDHTRLYEIVPSDESFAAVEHWETTALKASYAPPVHRNGLLFGYSGSILTAIDALSGAEVWKSRPPGKGSPILVGSHLVIWGPSGTLSVAPASGEGFTQLAGADALGVASLTAPAFAGGTIFVRNLTEIAAVAVRSGPAAPALVAPEIPAPTAGSRFGTWLEGLASVPDRGKAIDEFLAQEKAFPLVEGPSLVHFLYRGQAKDVAIGGSFTPSGAVSLQRAGGTDLFYRSYRLEPGARVEYSFIVDFAEPIPDPRNPRVAPVTEGKRSELLLAGWETSPYVAEPFDPPKGKLDSFEIASTAMGNTRTVHVYLPAGYDAGETRYSLLVVLDISGTRENGRLPEIVDRFAAAGHDAPLVAYVPFAPGWDFWAEAYTAPRRDDTVRFVADEMLLELERRFRLRPGREERVLMGFGWGAFPALYAAINQSEKFGKVALVSTFTYGPMNDELAAILDKRRESPTLDVELGWGRYDFEPEAEAVDLPAMNRALEALLRSHGHRVTPREILAGQGWGSWWAHVGPSLEAFF